MSEPEIDRDPAPFFLRQSIRFDTSKRLDQGALPMIDMTSGRENKMFFVHGMVGMARWTVRSELNRLGASSGRGLTKDLVDRLHQLLILRRKNRSQVQMKRVVCNVANDAGHSISGTGCDLFGGNGCWPKHDSNRVHFRTWERAAPDL